MTVSSKQIMFVVALMFLALVLSVGCKPETPPSKAPPSGARLSPISPLATSTKEPTPPSNDWPSLTPWPTLTPEPTRSGTPLIKHGPTPSPTPTRPPLLLTSTPVGTPPSDLQALYYVADNNGTPELRAIGIDKDSRKWSETVVPINLATEGLMPAALHLSPDSRYLAMETLGMASPLLITELSSGRVWCPFGKLEKCVGGFEGWISNNQILFRPRAGNELEGVILGSALIANVETGEYQPLDLPISSDRSYSFATSASPNSDDTRLAYSVTYPEKEKEISEIWTMPTDGQDKQLIRKVEGNGSTLSWSPSGKQLIHLYQPGTMRPSSDPYELWLLNADGTSEKLLARGQVYEPRWSSDGRYVAFGQADDLDRYFSDSRRPGTNIYVADTINGQITRLSAFKGRNNHSPTWSPDGKQVAFISVIPEGEPGMYNPGLVYVEVWIASVDGNQLYAVSGTSSWPGALAWLSSMPSAQEK